MTSLPEILAAWLRGPRLLPRAAAEFAFQSMGCGDAAELAALLLADTVEAESLRELAFFPDRELRLAVEAALPHSAAMDDAMLAQDVARRTAQAGLTLPGGAVLAVPLDQGDAGLVVARLRLGRGAGAAVAQALDSGLPGPAALEARVALRRIDHPRDSWAQDFLLATIRALAEPGEEFLDLLCFAARLLRAVPQGTDMAEALARRHASAAAGLDRARRFRRLLADSSMEILASQGLREPHVDDAELARERAWAERLAWAVYGRSLALERPAERDLGIYSDAAGLMRGLGEAE